LHQHSRYRPRFHYRVAGYRARCNEEGAGLAREQSNRLSFFPWLSSNIVACENPAATLKVPRAAVVAATPTVLVVDVVVFVVGGVSAAVSIATEHMRDGVTRAIRRGAHHGGGFSCWHTRAVGWAVSAAFTFLPKIEGYGG